METRRRPCWPLHRRSAVPLPQRGRRDEAPASGA
ncbi:hypothetical protein [Caulobacter sp. RHG1]|nr:hypothetical protein [Caulobacter sp. RHG1]